MMQDVTLEISENYLNFMLLKVNILAVTLKNKRITTCSKLNKTSAVSYYFSSWHFIYFDEDFFYYKYMIGCSNL